ncbi:MAG: DUF4058 family protein [Chloroflexi bacterium]|nr:DUF4058 family protein [Chloroflexota bacterium]
MPTPFPGMDPYLEKWIWEEVHTRLIIALADFLTPKISPKYRVGIEKRTYFQIEFRQSKTEDLLGLPDLVIAKPKKLHEVMDAPYTVTPIVGRLPTQEEMHEKRERYLEIREVATNQVITTLELLSPGNKRHGEGRDRYEMKRFEILASEAHFIEIDLVRAGDILPMGIPTDAVGDYHIIVSRAQHRPRADVYAFKLRQPIPNFPVPLLQEDPEPTVPLNQLVHELYDRARYDLVIDYAQPLKPPLAKEDQEWANALIKKISQTT